MNGFMKYGVNKKGWNKMKDYIEADSCYYPICPYCEIEVEETDNPTYETEDILVYIYRRGKCPTCRRKYTWSETYKWDEKFYDVREE